MPKRKTDTARIIDFFMKADEPAARAALDVAQSVVAARFEPAKPAADGRKKGRGGRRKKETQPNLPETNGGE